MSSTNKRRRQNTHPPNINHFAPFSNLTASSAMGPPPPPLLLAFLTLVLVSSSMAASSLDPKQLTALESMGIPTAVDPCSPRRNSTVCDSSSPFRHLVSLSLTDCSSSLSFPSSALLSLSSLLSLSLLRCHSPSLLRRPLPSPLASNLRSFSSVSSSPQISGVWLSRLSNLTSLQVLNTPIRASAPFVFFSQMPHLSNATVSGCNLSGAMPHHWKSLNLTHLDLSSNRLQGSVPNLIATLSSLRKLNLSSNDLNGTLPATVGDLVSLQEMSLSGNSISGPVPGSMKSMTALTHLDLSSNSFNGSLPLFFERLKSLKYLNLANNNFQGVLPFNVSFIERLDVFRIGGNGNLCYNHSLLSSKLKLGIAPCDKYGLPASPPPDKSDSSSSSSKSDTSDYDDDGDGGDGRKKSGGRGHHGPSTLVLVVAIGLSCLGFLVVFAICISKCRKCCS